MAIAYLTRKVRFSAGHRYHRPDWDEERNREVFGTSRNRHGHNYLVEVVVRGEVDPATGFIVDLGELDEVVAAVVEPLDQRDLTDAVDAFRPGARIPSTEGLAVWFWERLSPAIPGSAELDAVRVHEAEDLVAEYRGE